jgi:hypothetical protein
MKSLLLMCALLFCLVFPVEMRSLPPAQHFQSEQAAKQHCPNDVVVWVNVKTGVYHFKGERWYGATKDGAYACKKDADAEGDRATKNGQ